MENFTSTSCYGKIKSMTYKPDNYNSLSPYLIVDNAQKLVDLLKLIFDEKVLRRFDLENGMSQGDICRELGLDRAYISNVENGKQNLTLITMDKVAKVLGVSVEQLLK